MIELGLFLSGIIIGLAAMRLLMLPTIKDLKASQHNLINHIQKLSKQIYFYEKIKSN